MKLKTLFATIVLLTSTMASYAGTDEDIHALLSNNPSLRFNNCPMNRYQHCVSLCASHQGVGSCTVAGSGDDCMCADGTHHLV